MLQWAIYYDDGSRFTNLDGSPDQAPFFGVQAIGCIDGLWICRDRDGLLDYLQSPGMDKCVRLGRATSNLKYHTAAGWARNDLDLPSDRVIEEGETYYCWTGGDV